MSNHCEDKQPLLQVAVWSIGEYADLFLYAEGNEGTVKRFPIVEDFYINHILQILKSRKS